MKAKRPRKPRIVLKRIPAPTVDAPTQADPMRDAYVQACAKRMCIDYDKVMRDVDYAANYVRRYAEELQKYCLRLTAAQLRLANMEVPSMELDALQRAAFATEYDKLCELPLVERVECTKDALTVHTGMIYIDIPTHYDGKGTHAYKIGKFAVRIPLDAIYDIALENRKPPKGCRGCRGWHHPHIGRSATDICWGNVQGAIQTLHAKREYAALCSIILEWLQTFGYWGDHMDWIEHYPKVLQTDKYKDKDEEAQDDTLVG